MKWNSIFMGILEWQHPGAVSAGKIVVGETGITLWDLTLGPQPTTQEILDQEPAWRSAGEDLLYYERLRNSTLGRCTGCRLPADRQTSLATFQDVQGFGFQLPAGFHGGFYFDGYYFTAGPTAALWLAMNGPAFTKFGVGIEVGVARSAMATTYFDGPAAGYNIGPQPAGSAGAVRLPFRIVGNISTTAPGLLIVRFRSKTAGSLVTIEGTSQGLLVPVT